MTERDAFGLPWKCRTWVQRFDVIAGAIAAPIVVIIAIPFAVAYDLYRHFTAGRNE